MAPPAGLLEFGPFRLDAPRRLLWRGGELVGLAPKALDLLLALVQQAGQVVTKSELLERVWPDTFVEEANLSVNVSALRKALGTQDDGRPFIQTVARKGYRFTAEARPARATLRSLAVLPFRTLSGAEAEDTLGAGLADAVITRLSRLGQILVRPTSAVLRHAGRDPHDAGRELEVDGVLDGRVQRDGGRVRVTVQLVGTADGAALWAGTFDEEAAHLFAVQDAIAERLARALTLELTAEERERLARPPTRDADAYQAYLRGRYFWNKLTGAWLEKARESFEDALRRDERFALAHAGLADTYVMLGLYGLVPPAAAWPRARAAAERAMALDDGLAEPHVSLAYVRLFQDWAFADADRELGRAVALAPASAAARQWRALYLALVARFGEALEELRRAQELDPLSLTVGTHVGFHFYLIHRSEDEIEQHRRTLEMEPGYAIGHWALGLAYEQQGRHGEAVAAYRRALDLSGGNALMKSNLARALALAGEAGEARTLLVELEALSGSGGLGPYRVATIHSALGDRDAAVAWLETALRARDHWMVWLKVDPMLEAVRSDPRVGAMLEAVGFPADATLPPVP